MKKIILAAVLLFVTNAIFAHSDYTYTNTYGNVKTCISTGYDYEDKNKIRIAGQLINLLSKELRHKSEINIIIDHTYTSPDYKTKYCISYESNKIIIRGFCYRVIPLDLVKLTEYAIVNKAKLKNRQKEETFDIPFRKRSVVSTGDSVVTQAINQPLSRVVSKVLKHKIYRPEKDGEHFISTYYFQDNKYHITGRKYNRTTNQFEETILATYNDLFQFSVLFYEDVLVFDTDSSFVFHDSHAQTFDSEEKIFKRHVFNKLENWSRPYNVSHMGRDRICITIYYFPSIAFIEDFEEPVTDGRSPSGQNNMIYLEDHDFLIQDADDILDSIVIKRIKNANHVYP